MRFDNTARCVCFHQNFGRQNAALQDYCKSKGAFYVELTLDGHVTPRAYVRMTSKLASSASLKLIKQDWPRLVHITAGFLQVSYQRSEYGKGSHL